MQTGFNDDPQLPTDLINESKLKDLINYRKNLIKSFLEFLKQLAPQTTDILVDGADYKLAFITHLGLWLYRNDIPEIGIEKGVRKLVFQRKAINISNPNPLLEAQILEDYSNYGEMTHVALVNLIQHEFGNTIGSLWSYLVKDYNLSLADAPNLKDQKDLLQKSIKVLEEVMFFLEKFFNKEIRTYAEVLGTIPTGRVFYPIGEDVVNKGLHMYDVLRPGPIGQESEPNHLSFLIYEQDILAQLRSTNIKAIHDAYFLSMVMVRTLIDNLLKEDEIGSAFLDIVVRDNALVISLYDNATMNHDILSHMEAGRNITLEKIKPHGGLTLVAAITKSLGGEMFISEEASRITFTRNSSDPFYEFIMSLSKKIVIQIPLPLGRIKATLNENSNNKLSEAGNQFKLPQKSPEES